MNRSEKPGGGGSLTLFSLPTVNCLRRVLKGAFSANGWLASGAAVAAVVRGGGNAHAAELVGVILAVEDVPLFAAFEDFFLLRSDALADFGVGFLFFLQCGSENLHDLLADGVAVLDKLHLVAGDQHFGNLVRQANDFFPAESHARGP